MPEERLGAEALVEHVKKNYLGRDVREVHPLLYPICLDSWRIISFCSGMSEDNPLFIDPTYSRKTRWGCHIAPPTICSAITYPQPHVGIGDKPFKVLNFVATTEAEWVDVFRAGDSYTVSLLITDTYKKPGRSGLLFFMDAEGGIWNQHGALIVKQKGVQVQVDAPGEASAKDGGHLLYNRTEPYSYSQKEIKEITDCYDAETWRGSRALYWEDVNEGDKLPKMVRGPMTLQDSFANKVGSIRGSGPGAYKLEYKSKRNGPFSRRTNPATNWPYEDFEYEHSDLYLVKARGLGLPFDYGIQRFQMAETLITNWMGDDGFLRHLIVSFRKPHLYGDTVWFSGEVVKKYKVTEGGVEYGAVDIKIDGVNQFGEMSTPGTATAYLPSPGREVTVPIPIKVDVPVATK